STLVGKVCFKTNWILRTALPSEIDYAITHQRGLWVALQNQAVRKIQFVLKQTLPTSVETSR
ncbi:MAG: hypothetical protein AAFR67_01760, partial [Chloroflexota bacterium]